MNYDSSNTIVVSNPNLDNHDMHHNMEYTGKQTGIQLYVECQYQGTIRRSSLISTSQR